jgi:hypothetical protein
VPFGPRPGAVRQALDAWGPPQAAVPLVVEHPARTQDEAPRRWHGPRVRRPVAVESREGRVAQAAGRWVVGHARPLAPPQAQADAVAHAQAAEAGAPRGQGPRGRRPRLGRAHAGRARLRAKTRRPRRGRPATTDPPPTAPGDHRVVEVAARRTPEEDTGGTVLATTVGAEAGGAAARLHASQEQHPTVEPGWRWRQHPAAIRPVGREKPARMAASTCARRRSRAQGIKARPQRRPPPECAPGARLWPGGNSQEAGHRAIQCLGCSPLTGGSVTRSACPPQGTKRLRRTNSSSEPMPLERGLKVSLVQACDEALTPVLLLAHTLPY